MPLSRVSDSLAGRLEVHTLWPLAAGEVLSVLEGFMDAALSGQPPSPLGEDVSSPAELLQLP